ncbi:hypothetical protein BDC45DRAFT_576929 [Circinella umbellata]|nr:hypothetical protein BDC45DRAFT_576929 [Circinella umbellata]
MLSKTQKILETPTVETSFHDLMDTILDELKKINDFEAGEKLFSHLLEKLQLQDPLGRAADVYCPDKPQYSSNNRTFINAEIVYFRNATATMVRYAPHPEKSLKYASFFLNQIHPPLRDAKTEITILLNLIHVYKRKRSFDNDSLVFSRASHRILKYNNLQPTRDGKSLEQSKTSHHPTHNNRSSTSTSTTTSHSDGNNQHSGQQ